MNSTVSINNSVIRLNHALPAERHPVIPFGENIKVIASQTFQAIHTPGNKPLTALKVSLAIPIGLALIAVTIGLACLAILLHLAVAPIALRETGWSTQSIKDFANSSCKEVLAFALSVLSFPTDGTQFDPKPLPAVQRAAKTPVLLVHGYLHSSAGWHFIRKKLEAEGVPVYTINLGSPTNSISKDLAQKVKEKALQIAKETGRSDLLLVGHSMGGLASSEYATTYAAPGTIKGVITLGSPLQGTEVAKVFPGSAKEMVHQCPFTKQLVEKISKCQHIPFVNFCSKTDIIIRPTKAAQLSGKHITKHEFDSCGHLSYLFSSTVADSILKCYNAMRVVV